MNFEIRLGRWRLLVGAGRWFLELELARRAEPVRVSWPWHCPQCQVLFPHGSPTLPERPCATNPPAASSGAAPSCGCAPGSCGEADSAFRTPQSELAALPFTPTGGAER